MAGFWTLIRCGSLVALGSAVSTRTSLRTSKQVAEFHEALRIGDGELERLAQSCQCTFRDVCSCEGAIEFMNCIADACASNTCNCEGKEKFHSSCGKMAATCPSVDLSCSLPTGRASCPAKDGVLSAQYRAPPPDAAPAPPPVEVAGPAAFFPVPTASRCVVIICCQYMLIFVALALVKTYHELTATASGRAEKALKAAVQTVSYGPMLCVLFIACRMRVEFLSGGKDQPPMWVQHCMYASTFAVLATSLVVLALPLVGQQHVELKEGSCELEAPKGRGTLVTALILARYAIMAGLYCGIAGVIVGIFTYLPPGATDLAKLPAPAPAVMCTMILAVLFFVIQLGIAMSRTYAEFSQKDTGRVTTVLNAAADTVNFAPMLSILFLAARMRALQHDGQPQAWAQKCMFASTGALAVTAALAVAVPLILGGSMELDKSTGQARFKVKHPTLGKVLVAIRYLTMVDMYVGACGVIVSIFKFESPRGAEHTLPVSPTVQCVVNLCVQYFVIYLLLNVLNTLAEFGGFNDSGDPKLAVSIVGATGLQAKNFVGNNMKCSCVVKHRRYMAKPAKFETAALGNSLNPVWNETHELQWRIGEPLEFTVYDQGMLASKLEGTVVVPSEVFYPQGFAGEVPLEGVPNAKLQISVLPSPRHADSFLNRCFTAVDAAKATVSFAPMLAILFVTTRMYALLLTDKKGAPQAWVQDGMYMATWSLMVSFAVCLGSGLLVGGMQLDADGNVINKFDNKFVGIGMTALRYLTMLLLYGGIATVIVGLFVMTPETANGRGSLPFVTDTVNSTPIGNPPPGADAVAR
eukprot:TRINITY_DN338_c1_g1_i1.p1 TRINITY_DN338_c1_g1~~TRINITY_DN338_c1_g1_i1.p1  ORF type:complete len:808 (-),score=168.26 TRINITY_DN338_c1_g1_i1:134-2557(-)